MLVICSIILVCPAFALFQYCAFRDIQSHNYYYILGMIHYYEIFFNFNAFNFDFNWCDINVSILVFTITFTWHIFCQSFIFYFSKFFIINSLMWECILILLIIDSFWTFITTIYFSLLFFIIFSFCILLLERLGCFYFYFLKYRCGIYSSSG